MNDEFDISYDVNSVRILPGMILKSQYEWHGLCYATASNQYGEVDIRDMHNNIAVGSFEIVGWFWDFPEVVTDQDLSVDFGINRETANFIKEAIGK